MPAPPPTQSQLEVWWIKHKDKILIGTIGYLLGVNGTQTIQLKESNARADRYEAKYNATIQAHGEDQSNRLFRRLNDSDTTYIIGIDGSVDSAPMYKVLDSAKKENARH